MFKSEWAKVSAQGEDPCIVSDEFVQFVRSIKIRGEVSRTRSVNTTNRITTSIIKQLHRISSLPLVNYILMATHLKDYERRCSTNVVWIDVRRVGTRHHTWKRMEY